MKPVVDEIQYWTPPAWTHWLSRARIVHVMPGNDLIAHREGIDCPCNPTVEYQGCDAAIVIHAAVDGRGQWENELPKGSA